MKKVKVKIILPRDTPSSESYRNILTTMSIALSVRLQTKFLKTNHS